jgi:hypothetical protein
MGKMAELKFIKIDEQKKTSACCGSSQIAPATRDDVSCKTRLPVQEEEKAAWVTGTVATDAGTIFTISADLTTADYWQHVKCRTSAFRNNFAVSPGLYAVGAPDKGSDVFVSANYKLSFDVLRSALKGLNAWVLVLDTKGINVWCAAGKGTFGTDEVIQRISVTQLGRIVDHRRIIVPQLGAPGISAYKVNKASGFKVLYGPVRAEDIRSYVAAGYRATQEMRTVQFPFLDRLILTPMEINPAMKKYYPWYALIILVVFGLQPGGILFKNAVTGGLPFILLGLIAVLTGAFLTPALLPFIPFRSFAVKGWITGMLFTLLFEQFFGMNRSLTMSLYGFIYLFFPMASSYIALQFTGSTTFTGMSGVKKELRVSIPLYITGTVLSIILLALYKLGEWGLI